MSSAPSSTSNEGREEQFLFRCQSKALAERIHAVLNNLPTARKDDFNMELKWEKDREGTFKIGGDEFPCQLLDLPGVIESFKTYNDANLVKSTDVGQVILVREPGSDRVLHKEARHGLTPPMRDARKRHFRPPHQHVDRYVVEEVEQDLASVLGGHGLEGLQYHDVEEVWVEDEEGNGEWKPASSKLSVPKLQTKKLPPTGKRPLKKKSDLALVQEFIEEI